MIIESVAAAGMLLKQINTVIQNVNEGKANVQQAMALVSDFGEALNAFEVERKTSTFSPLSKNDILKLQMLRSRRSVIRKICVIFCWWQIRSCCKTMTQQSCSKSRTGSPPSYVEQETQRT